MKKDNRYRYFPHKEMREGQRDMMDAVYTGIRGDKYNGVMIAADPGIGKEACMTAQAILVLKDRIMDRIIFAIPTDAGKTNILKELAAVKHGYNVLKISSKEHLCKWLQDKNDPKILAIEGTGCGFMVCQDHFKDCTYKNECPYTEQKRQIERSEILICDYNYIISPFIRRFSGMDEILRTDKTLLFIDECHQIPDRAEQILSSRISMATIERAIKELEDYGYGKQKTQVEKIKDGLEHLIAIYQHELTGQLGLEYVDYGVVTTTMTNLHSFCGNGSELELVGKEISEIKFENAEGKLSYARVIGSYLNKFTSKKKYHKQTIFFVGKKKDGVMFMGWKPVWVGGYVRDALELSNKYVLYSGTINAPSFRKVMGLHDHSVLIPPRINSPFLKNRHDIIINNTVFKSDRYNDDEFKTEIKKNLELILNDMPKPAAIVCTNKWANALDVTNLPFLAGKIVDQPKEAQEVPTWFEQVSNYDYVRFSPYGRVSHSIDMSFLKSMLFVGFPHLAYNEVTKKKLAMMEKSYKGVSGNGKARARFSGYIAPAWNAVVQSAMRGLRTTTDRLIVVYYDKQFQMNKKLLNSLTLKVCVNVPEAQAEIVACSSQLPSSKATRHVQ